MTNDRALLVQLQRPSGVWVDVGLLHETAPRTWFESFPTYWNLPARPILGQTFEDHESTWRPRASTALPLWFSHLLPEGPLRAAVASATGTSAAREFPLLERLGHDDLPGAVRAVAAEPNGAPVPPEGTEDEGPVASEDPVLKFSLAGVQMKFSVLSEERGLTVPARGLAGDTIVKLPDTRAGHDGVPEAELGAMTLARAVGISTPEVRLVDPGSIDGLDRWTARATGSALAVARFDRLGPDRRVHMEELAQIRGVPTKPPEAKYRHGNVETIAVLVGALVGPAAVDEVVARVVLNVLVGNGDAHFKNWAVTYPDGVGAALSPAYDIVPTVLYTPDRRDDLGLNLNDSKDFTDVTPASFDRLAARTGLDVARTRRIASETSERVRQHWPLLADHLTVDAYQWLTGRLDTLSLRT